LAILFPFLFYSYGYQFVVICFHFAIFEPLETILSLLLNMVGLIGYFISLSLL